MRPSVRFALASACLLLWLSLGCNQSSNSPSGGPPADVLPTIAGQPQAQTVWSPQTATFSVQASGSGTLAYQWRKNGVNLPDGTLSTYTTGPTSANDHGAVFMVVVSSGGHSVNSADAVLSVNERPSIQQQPRDIVVVEGATATFLVQAQGTPVLHYQWKRNGMVIPGATDASYTLPSTVLADSGASFTVAVSNSLDIIASQPARLTVNPLLTPPIITQQPGPRIVNVGQTASFLVMASGSEPLAYQWRRNGTSLPGANSITLDISNAKEQDAGSYDVIVSNGAGSVTSAAATLTVVVIPPTITSQPADTVIGTGQTASFSVGISGSMPFQYQWRRDGAEIAGATNPTYITTAVLGSDDGARFSVRVSNSAGSVVSADATLHVFTSRTLHGQVGTLFEASGGEFAVGRDLRSVTVDILQPDGHGDFNTFPGQGLQDGTFTVQGVPPGPFYTFIRAAGSEPTRGLWTTNETMDLRVNQSGRPDGVLATSDQTALAVTIQGALAGQFEKLQTLVPNLGLVLELAGSGALYRYPWKGLPLVEASKDEVWVAGLNSQVTGQATVTTIMGALMVPSFSMAASSETRLSATATAVTADQNISWKADTDAYASLLSEVNPAVDPIFSRGPFRVDLLAEPYGFQVGPIPAWPSILEYHTTFAGILDSGVLAYADPFPLAWGRLVRLRQGFSFDLPIPGTAQLTHVSDAIEELWPMASWPLAPRTPLITPVLQPKVNGSSLFTPQASIGLTPSMTWTVRPPDQPSYFTVTIYKVDPTDGSFKISSEITTEVPNLNISSGLLQSGSYYLVRIVAFQSTGYDPNRPWQSTWPLVSAPVYSAILRP